MAAERDSLVLTLVGVSGDGVFIEHWSGRWCSGRDADLRVTMTPGRAREMAALLLAGAAAIETVQGAA